MIIDLIEVSICEELVFLQTNYCISVCFLIKVK